MGEIVNFAPSLQEIEDFICREAKKTSQEIVKRGKEQRTDQRTYMVKDPAETLTPPKLMNGRKAPLLFSLRFAAR